MGYEEDYKRIKRHVKSVPKIEQPKVSREVIADVGDDFRTILRRIEAKGLDIPEHLVKGILEGKVKGVDVYGALYLITRRGARR